MLIANACHSLSSGISWFQEFLIRSTSEVNTHSISGVDVCFCIYGESNGAS